jgi:2-oxoglutarate ferredoxin oxidoreductase subunit alpha
VLKLNVSRLTLEAVKDFGLSKKEALRCKNMWALGLVCWMFGRKRQATLEWLERKFAARPALAKANIAALNAGHAFGETAELRAEIASLVVPPAKIAPGLYRNVTGTQTLAWGLAVAAELPLVVINSQRAGHSTGMPTKSEQSDLYQAVFGRNADSPLVVLALRSPAWT